jgi:hypothetical protein
MSESKSPFKKVRVKTTQQVDIEGLFNDLKNRSADIKGLLAYQADILRDYHDHYAEAHDVSLELPTGSGKTLVGLLIAEWRRKILGERVLYLCPTKQLAYQVGKHSKEYDIETRVFVGSKKNYDLQDVIQYRSAKVIAVTTYSGLFNTSPGINDPQTIILDDAHGGETYISSMWSLNVSRQNEPKLFSKIITMFEKDLPANLVGLIHKSSRSRIPLKTEKVPSGAFYRHLEDLRELLDSEISNPSNSELYFPWVVIREGLQACHIYVTMSDILIRPYIPPTLTHKPFADANQRVYMSATLGRGGELERITGIREIMRIPTPKTYLSRSIGRRLFIFPDIPRDGSNYTDWIAHRLSSVDRTLALCPNQYEAQEFMKICDSCSPKLGVFDAKDIEENLGLFTSSVHSVLLLANRYDGIDLPHGICRQVILDGLPSRTNLQETFLEERLGLDILLRERIKTRIEQASGRCTRSDTDSAVIIMLGRRLLDFCVKKENQKIFHPEIRAEIRYALDQPNTLGELDAMLASFMGKDEHWNEAEQNIAEIRSSEELPDTSATDILSAAVKAEVDFAYAMWTQDYEKAVAEGRSVVDGLSGKKVAPYRALWCFFVAGAAFNQAKIDEKFGKVVVDYTSRAKEACKTVSWFPYELKLMLPERGAGEETSDLQARQVEAIVELLHTLGPTGPRFQRKMAEVKGLLEAKEANDFDRGLVELGNLLGFTSWKPAEDAEPDCVWQLGYNLLFVFEGKSDESSGTGISVQNCRQSSGHLNWAKAQSGLKDIEATYSILVTPKSSIDKEAIAHGKDVYFLAISDVLPILEKAKSVLVESREIMTAETTSELRDRVLQKLVEKNLTPEEISARLTSRLVTCLPTSKALQAKS